MEYVIADRNSTGMDCYWFERSIPTLDLAQRAAQKYPEAKYVLEYKYDYRTKGVLPTGRSWALDGEKE